MHRSNGSTGIFTLPDNHLPHCDDQILDILSCPRSIQPQVLGEKNG
jgi:hypothetical protein